MNREVDFLLQNNIFHLVNVTIFISQSWSLNEIRVQST